VAIQLPITPERKALFLKVLRETGSVRAAARAATPWATSIQPVSGFYDAREVDEEFARAWEESLDDFRGALEQELLRRAVDGYEETRTDHAGRVTTTLKYSDGILMFMARRHMPAEYGDKVEVAGALTSKVQVDPAALAAAVTQAAIAFQAFAQKAVEERRLKLLEGK
jgi:hypothetical protein